MQYQNIIVGIEQVLERLQSKEKGIRKMLADDSDNETIEEFASLFYRVIRETERLSAAIREENYRSSSNDTRLKVKVQLVLQKFEKFDATITLLLRENSAEAVPNLSLPRFAVELRSCIDQLYARMDPVLSKKAA